MTNPITTMSATITTVYHNKAGEIVASWEAAESVTYHTICTDEQADAAEEILVNMAHEFAEKHYKEVQKQNYSIRGAKLETGTYYMQTQVWKA